MNPTRPANRLARESSPYLLQHAHNPVQWFAWGEEAFDEARTRDVPIFLSIGYSTCYWCHVMERESFESDEIARIMNERFVCVKVDREERPAVDELYMAATTITTGHGGWPMSVFLEPKQLRPFFCGTYFPSKPMKGAGRPTFPELLHAIDQLWKDQRENVEKQAEEIAAAVAEQLGGAGEAGGGGGGEAGAGEPGSTDAAPIGREQVADAASILLRIFDAAEGGFSRAPKFPQPVFLQFLFDVRAVVDDSTRTTIDHALKLTLDKMACGGVFDQVGGGFHRYSVDAHWIVPHFEKMLYDQAQLASAYAIASRLFSDEFYASVARRILDYVLREMTHAQGAFFSAQDAEVNAREGLNYLWTGDDLLAALSKEDAKFAADVYGVAAGPNFQDPHHPTEPMRNVLRLEARPERVAERLGLSPEAFKRRLASINATLLAARGKRKQPHLDDKAIASWNGLMMTAFAQAGAILDEPRCLEAAERAMAFVLSTMRSADGRLRRTWRESATASHAPDSAKAKSHGQASGDAIASSAMGVLEDYACVIHALATLARAHADQPKTAAAHIRHAHELLAIAEQDFGDGSGALFDTPEAATDLFVRLRSSHDGATPSGVSVMLHALLDLHELTGDAVILDRARRLLASISGKVAESPISTVNATRALLRLLVGGHISETAGANDAEAREGGTSPDASGSQHPSESNDFLPVEIYAEAERVLLTDDSPASISLFVRIAPGYHLIAAEPAIPGSADSEQAAKGLIPFRVGIVHGTGVGAYADYPPGTDYGVPEAGLIRVYEGEFELRVALEKTGTSTGTPLISVTYQACDETRCLKPRTVEIDVAIDVA